MATSIQHGARYPVRGPTLAIAAVVWALWMFGWAFAPAEELVWAPLKWIIVAVFAPVGIVIGGALSGYRVRLSGNRLGLGFPPFTRRFDLAEITDVQAGGDGMSVWDTDAMFTVITRKGERIAVPCRASDDWVRRLREARG